MVKTMLIYHFSISNHFPYHNRALRKNTTSPDPFFDGHPNSRFPRHTAIGDMMTVICLDDYHTNDRAGRKARRSRSGLCGWHWFGTWKMAWILDTIGYPKIPKWLFFEAESDHDQGEFGSLVSCKPTWRLNVDEPWTCSKRSGGVLCWICIYRLPTNMARFMIS